jgi:tetratricopeptide (TPR) repeat protein
MNQLPRQDQRHLDAAEGWLGLGDHLSANEELEQITTELQKHPKVLAVRLEVYSKAKNWEAVVNIASTLATLDSSNVYGWIMRSFALHELKRTQEAYDFLLPVKDLFPKVYTVPYNLACYCSQLNRLEEAIDWFKKAMAIDEQAVKAMAIDDPDLKPLWDGMSGTIWEKD